jgi:hypothetical protein
MPPNFRPGELEQLAALLPLLRSGALQNFLKQMEVPAVSPAPPKNADAAMKEVQLATTAAGVRVGDGWTVQKTKKNKEAAKATKETAAGEGGVSDVLLPEGWSVPVLLSDGLLSSCTGVVLTSTSIAKQLSADMTGSKPLAVLSPGQVGIMGSWIHCLVMDIHGKTQCRRRWLTQLGPRDVLVEYCCAAPKREVPPDFTRVVVVARLGVTPPEVWKSIVEQPRPAIAKWLQSRAGISDFDCGRPTCLDGVFKIVCQVRATERLKCLSTSGADGVFVNPFLVGDSDRAEFKVVPVGRELAWEAARRLAEFHEDVAGVVLLKHGFGLRVLPSNFQLIVQLIHKDEADKFLGETYAVTGLPVSMGSEGLRAFLSPWQAAPVRSFRNGFVKTWIVRAGTPPVDRILQHEFGIAVIKDDEPRRARPPPSKAVWSSPSRTDTSFHPKAQVWPKCWADVVTNAPTMAPTAASQEVVRSGGGAAVLGGATPPASQGLGSSPGPSQASTAPASDLAALVLAAVTTAVVAAMQPIREELSTLKNSNTVLFREFRELRSGLGRMDMDESDGELEVGEDGAASTASKRRR